jgi:hypothetical protein
MAFTAGQKMTNAKSMPSFRLRADTPVSVG